MLEAGPADAGTTEYREAIMRGFRQEKASSTSRKSSSEGKRKQLNDDVVAVAQSQVRHGFSRPESSAVIRWPLGLRELSDIDCVIPHVIRRPWSIHTNRSLDHHARGACSITISITLGQTAKGQLLGSVAGSDLT
jgi:hypothetical protein